MVASGSRKARAISSVVRPQIIRSASAARASRDRRGWQAVKISRSNSSPISSSRAASEIGHGLLLLLHVPGHHLVLAREHLAAAQMIQRPALGGRHQPRAGLFRNAGGGPVLERRQQRFLRQVLGQRHVAQHPRQAGDQPRLLDAPDGEDRAVDVGGRHRRRLGLRHAASGVRAARRLRRRRPSPARQSSGPRRCLPSPACDPCGAA